MRTWRWWQQKVQPALLVVVFVFVAYYVWGPVIILESLDEDRTRRTAHSVTGWVNGIKVLDCTPSAVIYERQKAETPEGQPPPTRKGYQFIQGYVWHNGLRRPADIESAGTGVRNYPRGKTRFGLWTWTVNDGLPIDEVGLNMYHGCGLFWRGEWKTLVRHRTDLRMPLEPRAGPVVNLSPKPDMIVTGKNPG